LSKFRHERRPIGAQAIATPAKLPIHGVASRCSRAYTDGTLRFEPELNWYGASKGDKIATYIASSIERFHSSVVRAARTTFSASRRSAKFPTRATTRLLRGAWFPASNSKA
jgi:hypothetical protein